MTTYNIFLGNPTHLAAPWNDICGELARLFLPVIQKSNQFNRVRVRSTMRKPAIQSHELLIFILPSRSNSIVRPHFTPNAAGGNDGYTAWHSPGKTGSEVYRRRWSPAMVARLAYHEALHNKLHIGNGLHGRGGLASEVISEETEERDKNIRDLAKALGRPRAQWVNGFDAIGPGGPLSFDDSDPLSGL